MSISNYETLSKNAYGALSNVIRLSRKARLYMHCTVGCLFIALLFQFISKLILIQIAENNFSPEKSQASNKKYINIALVLDVISIIPLVSALFFMYSAYTTFTPVMKAIDQ